MLRILVPVLTATVILANDATSGGARVHYESYGTGKDALVFIHGWTCDLTFWRGQEPVYKNRRSLLIDLPGHGASDKPDVSYTQERFARAIEAVMRDAGIERGVLIGHSMGGPVALTFLRLFPTKTKALVLVDAYIPPVSKNAEQEKGNKQLEAFANSFRKPGYKETAAKVIDSMFTDKTTAAQREEIRSKMLASPQHVTASAMEGMAAMEPPKPGEVYKLPVLTIMAERPGRTGYEAQVRTVFPNLTYEEWQGSGHFLMMESPDRFNQALTNFLATVK